MPTEISVHDSWALDLKEYAVALRQVRASGVTATSSSKRDVRRRPWSTGARGSAGRPWQGLRAAGIGS